MRKIKAMVTLIILLLTAALPLGGCAAPKGVNYTAEGYSLNTYVKITLYGCGSRRIAEEAVKMCSYYEGIFSRTSEASVLFGLNEAGRLDVETREDGLLADAVALALRYGEMTEGALDITIEPLSSAWSFGSGDAAVPRRERLEDALELVDYRRVEADEERIELNGARLDLGAVAKGYIADRIKEYLIGEGVDSALIYLGGNVLCIGNKPDGADFVIGLQKPFGDENEVLCALGASDLSVVTSGVYERFFYEDGRLYHHILDPQTGFPCNNGLLSVTIISESSALCDALSTACFVMGYERARRLVDGMEGVYAVFVDSGYNVLYSEGAQEFVKE
ncbi:MAG: FAD:protein FMN transferase [Butyrivibrio sp.]|nr:FAD:protein FMN transferase [Butyrivibrio sp.]